MDTVLYIGHSFHQKTKSSGFLLEQLKASFDVTELYLDSQEQPIGEGTKVQGTHFDILVIWQIMPDVQEMRKHFTWERGVFFPMYDHFLDTGGLYPMVWKDYADFTIICFSRKLHEELTASGFDAKYIQYFPQPKPVDEWGREDGVFFWQRREQPNLQTLMAVAEPLHIRHIHLHQAPDPGFRSTQLPMGFSDIQMTSTQWFEKKEDMFREIGKYAYYMAPRLYEGIGLSFLDAMSMGRCVIAPDTPTMNEYITDGVNGILYSCEGSTHRVPRKTISLDVRALQANAYHTIEQGYKEWMINRYKIIEWCQQEPNPDVECLRMSAKTYGWNDTLSPVPPSAASSLAYALYLPEIWFVIQQLCLLKWQLLKSFFIVHLSSRFNRKWYLAHYSGSLEPGMAPAAHYLCCGWKQGKNPSSSFFTNLYIKQHPDLLERELCPLVHRKMKKRAGII